MTHDPKDTSTTAAARPPEELHKQPDGRSRVAKESNPRRSDEHPQQTAEVPYGTGRHSEPPGGGGRPAQRRKNETDGS